MASTEQLSPLRAQTNSRKLKSQEGSLSQQSHFLEIYTSSLITLRILWMVFLAYFLYQKDLSSSLRYQVSVTVPTVCLYCLPSVLLPGSFLHLICSNFGHLFPTQFPPHSPCIVFFPAHYPPPILFIFQLPHEYYILKAKLKASRMWRSLNGDCNQKVQLHHKGRRLLGRVNPNTWKY